MRRYATPDIAPNATPDSVVPSTAGLAIIKILPANASRCSISAWYIHSRVSAACSAANSAVTGMRFGAAVVPLVIVSIVSESIVSTFGSPATARST